MSLAQNTAKGAYWDFRFSWHDHGIDNFIEATNKSDVTSFLGGFVEADRFKVALDLAKGLRLKPPQPQPRWFGLAGDEWLAAARGAVPKPLLGLREPPLRLRLGWQRPLRGIERRTNFLRARQLRQMGVAWVDFRMSGALYEQRVRQFGKVFEWDCPGLPLSLRYWGLPLVIAWIISDAHLNRYQLERLILHLYR
jgi:hypothetical protein